MTYSACTITDRTAEWDPAKFYLRYQSGKNNIGTLVIKLYNIGMKLKGIFIVGTYSLYCINCNNVSVEFNCYEMYLYKAWRKINLV